MSFYLSSFCPVITFVIGLGVGRFLNTCIARLPHEDRFWASLRSLVHRPRDCDGCHELRPRWQSLPLIGSLLTDGCCPCCRRRIPRRDALVELLTAGLFVALYYFEASTGNEMSTTQLAMRSVYHLVLICSLIVATFIDFDWKIIPDGSTLPAMVVGLVGAWVLPDIHLVPIWSQSAFPLLRELGEQLPQPLNALAQVRGVPAWVTAFPHLHGLAVSVAGLMVGGGVVWAIRLIGHRALGREAMGFGDVILMAMIGSFLGWQPALVVFFLAPLCALVAVVLSWIFWRNREIPFGPYLSLAALLVLFGWDVIWPRSEQIFGLGILLPVLAVVMFSGLALLLMLTRGIQRLLGIEPELELIEEWTPGDQLAFLAGSVKEPDQGQWPRETWPGTRSGQGSLYRRQWRDGRL